MIIVIDGPSGSGKSSTARAVAERLGINYLDSGALYRAITWIWLEEGKPDRFIDILASSQIRFHYEQGRFTIQVDGKCIDHEIRGKRVSDQVSRVAAMKPVRAYVNRLMRERIRDGIYIADGRDLGTAVFPDADVKIYMDASLEVRADRRFRELKRAGHEITRKEVNENLAARDRTDRSRSADPLAIAEDAIRIDNSSRSFEQLVDDISRIIRERIGPGSEQ